jgi:hypothetical protein
VERLISNMKEWPYTVEYHSRKEIQVLTKDVNWQVFRKSLIGMPTTQKLEHLLRRLDAKREFNAVTGQTQFKHEEKVRVDNYLNALLRGGQLNVRYQVVKER